MSGWWTDSCCCFSLRTGSLLLGYFGLIAQFFGSFLFIFQIVNAELTVKALYRQEIVSETTLPHPLVYSLLVTLLGTLLVISLSHGVISLLLLLGVYKENEKYLQVVVYAWVAFNYFSGLTSCTRIIYKISLGFYGEALLFLFASSIGILLATYFIIVVHSYRLQLKEGKKNASFINQTHV